MNMEVELRKLEKIVPELKTKEEVEMVSNSKIFKESNIKFIWISRV